MLIFSLKNIYKINMSKNNIQKKNLTIFNRQAQQMHNSKIKIRKIKHFDKTYKETNNTFKTTMSKTRSIQNGTILFMIHILQIQIQSSNIYIFVKHNISKQHGTLRGITPSKWIDIIRASI